MRGKLREPGGAVPAILIVAGLLRIALALFLGLRTDLRVRGFETPAGSEFIGMARGFLATGEFTYFLSEGQRMPSAYQPPLYPAGIAGLIATFGESTAFLLLQALQIGFGVWAVWLTFRLAQQVFDARVATLAAGLAACHPALVFMPNEVHSISLQVPLLVLSVLLAMRIRETPSDLRAAFGLGAVLGAAALLRSEIALVAPVFLGLAWSGRKAWLAALVVCGLVYGPQVAWVARNAQSLGKPVLTTTAGVNLWRGNGDVATGGSYRWDGNIAWYTPEIDRALAALAPGRDYEIRMDRIYADALRDSLRQDPTRPLRLLPIKAAFFLTSDFTHPKGRHPLAWFPAVLLLPFAAIGIARLRREGRPFADLLFWPAVYLGVSCALFALPRYRLNVEPFIIVLAAAGMDHVRRRKEG